MPPVVAGPPTGSARPLASPQAPGLPGGGVLVSSLSTVDPTRSPLGGSTCWAARGRRHHCGTVSTVAVGSGSIPGCGVWGVRGLQVDRGPGLAAGGRGCERGGGGGQRAIPAPLTPWAGSPLCPSGPLASAAPPRRRAGGGGGGAPATVLVTPGARRSRSAAAAAPPAVPPTPHDSVGLRATARAGPRPRGGGPSAIASPWGALVGCGRIDTLQPGRGSGHRGHSRRGVAGAGTAAVPTAVRAGRVQ